MSPKVSICPHQRTCPPHLQITGLVLADRSRSSGKAVVGWLKLKVALRCGIFVRKKAAERRAQLVELDDS
ncbi:hypothetical protein SADUNF_Sadunf04G0021100 [Salix dunnii]|uniref:Uncharacterized protein n=1 Tax=Salix dunnii TaxID=1413687 RepID=A0A835K7N0_9ROSI|nr:hypothetical protein SADUNF_Sadunf04G0021100 [Salix dunnii]